MHRTYCIACFPVWLIMTFDPEFLFQRFKSKHDVIFRICSIFLISRIDYINFRWIYFSIAITARSRHNKQKKNQFWSKANCFDHSPSIILIEHRKLCVNNLFNNVCICLCSAQHFIFFGLRTDVHCPLRIISRLYPCWALAWFHTHNKNSSALFKPPRQQFYDASTLHIIPSWILIIENLFFKHNKLPNGLVFFCLALASNNAIIYPI